MNLQEQTLIVRHRGRLPYAMVWQEMKDFATNAPADYDEVWLLQHDPVYTQGVRCKESPSPAGKDIPVYAIDRGGLMTYHGPGQLILYCLINLKRKNINIKELVSLLEQAVINLLKDYNIIGNRLDGAPGVYLNKAKLASIGLRVRNDTSYHGLSVNFDMDLTPFNWINPCGFEALEMSQFTDLIECFNWNAAQERLLEEFTRLAGYSNIKETS